MRKRLAKMRNGLPNGVVHEYTTATDSTMKLRGYIAGLTLHPVRVGLPSFEQFCNIAGCDGEQIDQNDRRSGLSELVLNGD